MQPPPCAPLLAAPQGKLLCSRGFDEHLFFLGEAGVQHAERLAEGAPQGLQIDALQVFVRPLGDPALDLRHDLLGGGVAHWSLTGLPRLLKNIKKGIRGT